MEVSIEKSPKVNTKDVAKGHCEVIQADVLKLPLDENGFDLATAFETICFWPGLANAFGQCTGARNPVVPSLSAMNPTATA